MTFTRTSSGLSNLPLFYETEYVVFVEGGSQQYSLNCVEHGKSNSSAIDIAFWKTIFKKYNFEYSYTLKAVGSKTTCVSIAEKVLNHSAKNIVVAMDRDFDFVNNNVIRHPRVLYTFGYSWENDIWQKDQVKAFLEHMLCVTSLSSEHSQVIENCYEKLERNLFNISKLQYGYNKIGIEFIPTQKTASILKNNTDYPEINHSRVITLAKEASIKKKKKNQKVFDLANLRKCHDITGKIHKSFGYTLINKLYKEVHNCSIGPKNIIDTNLISFCANLPKMGASSLQDNYYAQSFESLHASVSN